MRVFTSLAKFILSFFPAIKTRFLVLVACVFSWMPIPFVMAGEWLPLAKDGIHDPRSPGTKQLQQPRDALSKLTSDTTGNQVRWIQALEKGEIQPREKLFAETEVKKLDRDIILNINGGMPAVRFPHRQHTEWLDCSNCHEGIFASETGKTKISMYLILQGEQCGVCHGAVAFPLTECMRCHSIAKQPGEKPQMPPGINPLMHQSRGAGQ